MKGVSVLYIRLMTYSGTRNQGAFNARTSSGAGVACGPMNSSPRMIVTLVIMTEAQMMLGIRIQFLPFVHA